MLTVDNAAYGINNVIEELEHVLVTINVYARCHGTKAEHDVDPSELRAKISIASMQLSALADDFDQLVINDDSARIAASESFSGTKSSPRDHSTSMTNFFPVEAETAKRHKKGKQHGK